MFREPDSFGFLYDRSLKNYNIVWQINYTMFFLAALAFANFKKFKSISLSFVNLLANVLIVFIFITLGLYLLGNLRDTYLLQENAQYFERGAFHIVIRYISYGFLAGLLLACYGYVKQKFLHEVLPEKALRTAFDFLLYIPLLYVLSAELITWMDVFGVRDSYKLGLSILWGIYALLLIVLGIYYHKKHLRIGAIALFGITLAKLFFYDIAELDTISKTVVFVSLGILMLIVSFLYNKYKHLIFENPNPSEVS